eukprot:gene41547-65651_t
MKNILVVGADRGIANRICLQLQARGERVFAACLGNTSPFDNGIEAITGIDVTSSDAPKKLVDALNQKKVRLDWVLHVAGVLGLDTLGEIDYDDMRRQFEINTI